ncbi:hypothetical protein AVEN_100638-1 [Araneus ventricosus]|uniref:Uncharacterized protein n=1 Tax=Araneus ventricosus TaxID=182803 RepID=A0A4Y2UV10_ARAVE|nr:hypothetical protein AVEN_100638-1 [Araneus ventricosus]
MFCQWCDRIYSTSAKKVVLTCGHEVHECCAKHLVRPFSLKCMKPLTDKDMDEIRRVSRDASSTDSWTDSSTDDEMNASTDECQTM